MSNTPRTDAQVWRRFNDSGTEVEVVHAYFARQLERENAELRRVLVNEILISGGPMAKEFLKFK